MCLTPDIYIHTKRRNNGIAPLIARKPILVFKVVEIVEDIDGNDIFKSPYMGHEWVMGKAEVVEYMHTDNYDDIEEGLHAYRNEANAKRHSKYMENAIVVYGIIPVGARFWVGNNNDIASNELTLYRTLDDIVEIFGYVDTENKPVTHFI